MTRKEFRWNGKRYRWDPAKMSNGALAVMLGAMTACGAFGLWAWSALVFGLLG